MKELFCALYGMDISCFELENGKSVFDLNILQLKRNGPNAFVTQVSSFLSTQLKMYFVQGEIDTVNKILEYATKRMIIKRYVGRFLSSSNLDKLFVFSESTSDDIYIKLRSKKIH